MTETRPPPLPNREKPPTGTPALNVHPDILKLPLYKQKEDIARLIKSNDNLIVVAGTGSGKTVALPVIMREALGDVKVIVTQPRKAAADGVSSHLAEITDGKAVGNLVGLRHKGKNLTSDETKILFEVEGSLLNQLKEDPNLLDSDIDVVIVDEVHERGVNTDLVMALLKKAQSLRPKDRPLKIVATSATLDAEKVQSYLSNAPIKNLDITSPYEVHDWWDTTDNLPELIPKRAAEVAVDEIIGKNLPGDMIIFMPGKGEITQTQEAIRAKLAEKNIAETDFDIRTFDGRTTDAEKEDFKNNTTGKRRIIVATNVAETSITIPLAHVIDSGLIKQTMIDPYTGIELLDPQEHAQSGIRQRKGRTGRVMEGTCYHLYTEDNFNKRSKYQLPAIQRADITSEILTLRSLGIDINKLDLLDRPDNREIENANRIMDILGAVDKTGRITEIGREMADYQIEPHLSRMLVEAKKEGVLREAATMAAMVNHAERLFFGSPEEINTMLAQYKDPSSDFLTYLNLWTDIEKNRSDKNWLENHHINRTALKDIRDLKNELADYKPLTQISPEVKTKLVNCLAIGFTDRMLIHLGQGKYQMALHPEIQNIFLSNRSQLFTDRPFMILAGNINMIKKTGQIFAKTVQAIDHEGKNAAMIKSAIAEALKPIEKEAEKETVAETKPVEPTNAKPDAPEPHPDPEPIKLPPSTPIKDESLLHRFWNYIKKILGKLNPLNLLRWLADFFRKKK